MPENAALAELKEINTELRTDVVCLGEKIDALDNRQTHQKWALVGVAAGGVVIAMLVAAVIVALVRVDNTNEKIARQQVELEKQAAYDVASCERGNKTREAQRQQWIDVRTALGAFPDPTTKTLATKLVTNAFENFPKLDCLALQRGEEPTPVSIPVPSPVPVPKGRAE